MADESIIKDIRVAKISKATYNRWRIEIKDALESHRIWDIACGIITKPEEVKVENVVRNKKEIDDWRAKDSKARSIIRSTLDDTTFDQVCDCESSADIINRVKSIYEPKTLNVLLELLCEFFAYSWKSDSSVGTFVAGLKMIIRKIEAIESEDFGRNFNEKLIMAKILGCLPKVFDNFVTSWSLLSGDMSLDVFLEKLTNAERNIEGRSDEVSQEVFKAQEKSSGNTEQKKKFNKKFIWKCNKCGMKGHTQKYCRSKSSENSGKLKDCERKEYKPGNENSGLSASSVFSISNNSQIVADSEASVHLTRNLEWFSKIRKLASPITLNVADGKSIWATHVGDIKIDKSINGKQWEERIWENVYYSKDMSAESLFSTTYMETTKGYGFCHENGLMRLTKGQRVILGGRRAGNRYVPFIQVKPPTISAMAAQSVNLWHQRLGHVNGNLIKIMSKNNLANGLEVIFTDKSDCDSCYLGKQTVSPHPVQKNKRVCLPGQRFHSDVCHIGILSWNKCKYFP